MLASAVLTSTAAFGVGSVALGEESVAFVGFSLMLKSGRSSVQAKRKIVTKVRVSPFSLVVPRCRGHVIAAIGILKTLRADS